MMNHAKVFRNKLLWMTLVLGVVGACWISLNWQQQPRINVDAPIESGMTEEVVIAALGGPPGNYVGSRLRLTFSIGHFGGGGTAAPPGSCLEKWIAEDGAVYVYFSPDGKVLSTYREGVFLEEAWWDTFIASCRSCLKW